MHCDHTDTHGVLLYESDLSEVQTWHKHSYIYTKIYCYAYTVQICVSQAFFRFNFILNLYLFKGN